jgi:hypothetical protein
MIISDEHKYIFIHIPKNAGTSIEVSLTGRQQWDDKEKHLTAAECRAKLGFDKWREFFSFCVVRNPWDRLVSQFRFSGEIWCNRHYGKSLSFNDYIKEIVGKGLPFSGHDYLSKTGASFGDTNWQQVHRICDDNNQIIVNYVARFENLSSDYEVICNRIGLHNQLQHINQSDAKSKPYWNYYTEETARIVADVYAEDIERFDYHFRGV